MRQRLYSETMPALGYFWVKTLCASGYDREQWKELSVLLELAQEEPLLDSHSREVVIEIKNWIRETVRNGQTPEDVPPHWESVRAGLNSEGVTTYIVRLLNEWLPVEVARQLIDGCESKIFQDGAVSILTIGRAIEELLVRQHLSIGTLEMLLEPQLLSSKCVYPSDLEMLRDAVLSLLGRTSPLIPAVMPATLLCVVPDSQLPATYRDAVHHAYVIGRDGEEEVRVPIAASQALEIIDDERVRIGSIIVTMDGRCWEAENLECTDQHCVVYRPAGRLRIDYSGSHAKLRVPWPESRLRWSGNSYFMDAVKIFGREWRVSKWEVDAERTWLHLVFSRVLSMSEIDPDVTREASRLRPSSVDMAWSALDRALTTALIQKSSAPIDQLRHSDLIPLGHAIVGLTESVKSARPQTCAAIETYLQAFQHLESTIVSAYGRLPWRILPKPVRNRFLELRRYPSLLRLLNEVIEGLPEEFASSTDDRTSSYDSLHLFNDSFLQLNREMPVSPVSGGRSAPPQQTATSGMRQSRGELPVQDLANRKCAS